ncbi:MAG: hypothetical protein WCI04_06295 [archaeon]
MNKLIFVLILLISTLLIFGCTGSPKACTEEALLCPDGNAVGRAGPNCAFTPCPNCVCPGESWILNGDMCIPKCSIQEYPGAPVCNLAKSKCVYENTQN